jgi:uncharacterized phage-like protein YoqJ
MKNINVCFSGHRKIDDPTLIYEVTESEIISLIQSGSKNFLNGMAWGFDLMAAQIILNLKKHYPHIKLISVLPCAPHFQTKKWSGEGRKVYYDVLRQADEAITLSEEYHSQCMLKRNDFMVKHSQCCVCYLTKQTGGTAYTVRRAREKRLEIINIVEKMPITLLT